MKRCSPKTGQHIGYAGNVTQKSNNRIIVPLHAYLAGGKLYGYSFAKKPAFPYNKDLFAITTKLLVVIEMVPPTNVSFPIIK